MSAIEEIKTPAIAGGVYWVSCKSIQRFARSISWIAIGISGMSGNKGISPPDTACRSWSVNASNALSSWTWVWVVIGLSEWVCEVSVVFPPTFTRSHRLWWAPLFPSGRDASGNWWSGGERMLLYLFPIWTTAPSCLIKSWCRWSARNPATVVSSSVINPASPAPSTVTAS